MHEILSVLLRENIVSMHMYARYFVVFVFWALTKVKMLILYHTENTKYKHALKKKKVFI